ncbi:sn-glycerol-3-phosphate ABC transporter ATP-binding protein UgpC [soil metagenome]
MAEVSFREATRIYPGTKAPAVDRLDLTIEDGEFLVLVGPSGSGKSTALRMLAGLEACDEGSIWIGDRDVTLVQPKDRDVAMVFQSYALYPHMTVAQNIGFPLKQQKAPKEERARQVMEAARILDLVDYLDRKPKHLSGGQRQRVAMGRAIVRHPKFFLMDEPLSNLDAKLRVQTRAELADLQARLGVTTVYVTHDQVEAMTMGHRVAILDYGVMQQVATPGMLYRYPTNLFVAGFIGSPAMNLIPTTHDGATAEFGSTRIPLDAAVATQLAKLGATEVTIGIRPQALAPGAQGVAAEVVVVEALGPETFVFVELEHLGKTIRVRVRVDADYAIARGDHTFLEVLGPVHVFGPDGLRLKTAHEGDGQA